jgi:hypothetical protein
MNKTLELLRAIGSVEDSSKPEHDNETYMILYQYATSNRMLFYFLDATNAHNVPELTSIYQMESAKLIETDDAIGRAARALDKARVHHAVIKTVRPYRSTTVDIDIIELGSDIDYERGKQALIHAGYTMLGEGPQSATIQDPEIDMKVDLYREIAVSHIIYLDKRKLSHHLRTSELTNGKRVTLLSPEADLATVLAHSVIKEHMYTLSEFYTFIHYLPQINTDQFLSLVRDSNTTVPTRAHATITAVLHEKAFGTVPLPLRIVLDQLGMDMLEAQRVKDKGLKMPHKYHPLTVARSLLEIAKSRKSRKSFGLQILRMLRPSFTKQFTKLFLDHITRETY